jgi:predicted RNA-binding Zn-ribbon protein involved in translation (DUF1610 family)
MDDFITLNCPSCGGKLIIGKNTSVLKCEQCGSEHFVRREDASVTLESFARCPRCNRNDRVEKITSILRSQKQEIETREQRTSVYYNGEGHQRISTYYVPVKNTQISNLTKYLEPPPKPRFTSKPHLLSEKNINVLQLLGIIITIIFFCNLPIFLLSIPIINNPDSGKSLTSILCCATPLIILLPLGIMLIIIGNKKRGMIREKNEKAKEENKIILNKWRNENQKIQDRWESAIKRWNNLYFCYRDDCVFLPDEGTYAPVDQMRSYIFKNKI